MKDGAVISKSIRRDILVKAHSTHQGDVRTKQCLRSVVYWSVMSSEIEEMRKDCRICQELLPQDELSQMNMRQYAELLRRHTRQYADLLVMGIRPCPCSLHVKNGQSAHQFVVYLLN